MKMLDYARANNIPVWNELSWLEFLQAKDEAKFDNLSWTGEILTFSIHSKLNFQRNLSCLIPYRYNDKKLVGVRLDDEENKYSVVRIKGFEYARILVTAGSDHNVEASFGSE